MTATPSSEARAEARAEAERRYPAPTLPGDNIGLRVGFVEGVEWKGAQVEALIQAARTFVDTFTTASGSCLSCTGEDGEHEDDCDIGMFAHALSGVESSDEGEADASQD